MNEDGTAAFSSSWLPGNDKYCSFSLFIFTDKPSCIHKHAYHSGTCLHDR
jgi:hypothetical protein